MPSPITRRTFLAAGAAFAVAAACGGSDDGGDADTETGTGDSTQSAQGPDEIQVIVASAQLLAGSDQRVIAGVLDDNGEPLRLTSDVNVAFGRSFDKVGPWQPAEFHDDGIEERPYYRTTYAFEAPGDWVMAFDAGGKKGATAIKVISADQTDVPLVGEKMIPVKTPTVADKAGVDPICTADPQCAFHDVSLDAALQGGMPVAAIFSTPALCQSRVCGPVLDVLVKEAEAFRDRIRFVHVEVYKSMDVDFSSRESLSPGMQAYHLTFEPVLFLARPDGTIAERLDGPYDAAECRDALTRLVS